MRIFLTGEKQIGKSTVLQRTVELLGAVPGGFYTRYWEPASVHAVGAGFYSAGRGCLLGKRQASSAGRTV